MLERREPSLREIIDFRKKTAAVHIETPPDYTVVRGLWDSNVTKIKTEGITQRRESGYDSIFGVFEGKRMSEWIEELIGKRGKVRVLDIGCGAGRFLNDLKEKFGDDVQAYGVSALRYGEYGPLEEKGIKIAIGDAQALISLLDKAGLPQEGYDVVTSVFSMMYFADELATFKQAYNILSEGGMGFFHGIGFGYSEDYIKREMGLEQSSSVRIFVKNRPRLTLPDLRYSLLFKLGEQTPESICYTVDSEHV